MNRIDMLYLLSTVESELTFQEDGDPTLPLWVVDRLRDCLDKLRLEEGITHDASGKGRSVRRAR